MFCQSRQIKKRIMKTTIVQDLIDVKTYQPLNDRQYKYVHIKKSDYASNYNEVGLLLLAGMMLDKEEIDLLVINNTPFTQENMRIKGGRFVWSRYAELSVNAYNIDVVREFISFARSLA